MSVKTQPRLSPGATLTPKVNATRPEKTSLKRVKIEKYTSVVLRPKRQVTLPREICEHMGEDVIPEGIDPVLLRKPGVKYFIGSDSEEFIARDSEYIKAAQDIFGHLIK